MPIRHGERKLSFDKTLVFHVKMHRLGASTRSRFRLPCIPCISDKYGDWERKSPVAVEDGGECRCGGGGQGGCVSAVAWFVGRRAPLFAGGVARRRGRTNEKILAVAQMQRRPTRRMRKRGWWRDSSDGGFVVRSEKKRRAEQPGKSQTKKWRERVCKREGLLLFSWEERESARRIFQISREGKVFGGPA